VKPNGTFAYTFGNRLVQTLEIDLPKEKFSSTFSPGVTNS
jgi:hypothetical protein